MNPPLTQAEIYLRDAARAAAKATVTAAADAAHRIRNRPCSCGCDALNGLDD